MKRSGSPSDSNQRSPAQFDSSSVSARPTARSSSSRPPARARPPRCTSSRREPAGRRGDVGGRGDEEGALGSGLEELVQRRAADLRVVEDDDRADRVDEVAQLVPFRPVQGRAVHGGEEVVQEVVRAAPVAGETDDAVGREVRAVLGDGLEQAGAAG